MGLKYGEGAKLQEGGARVGQGGAKLQRSGAIIRQIGDIGKHRARVSQRWGYSRDGWG